MDLTISLSSRLLCSTNITLWTKSWLKVGDCILIWVCKTERKQRAKHKRRRPSRSARTWRIYKPAIRCFTSTSIEALTPTERFHIRRARFDSDSVPIAIDNCASRCLTTTADDFLPGTARTLTRPLLVKGLAHLPVSQTGTVAWELQDDQGLVHSFQIKNVLLLPSLPHQILSPQHVAQQIGNNFQETTTATHVTLVWGQQKHHLTVPLGSNNVAITRTAPRCRTYAAFLANTEATSPSASYCFPIYGEGLDEASQTTEPESLGVFRDAFERKDTHTTRATQNLQDELLHWHQRLGHTSMRHLQWLASKGILPRRLTDCPRPTCGACQFSKQTRRPWKYKGEQRRLKHATRPGECVSVDQMYSTIPGLIAQLKGTPTNKRYNYATIFLVDHFSGKLSFVYLQQTISAAETLQAKHAFEQFAKDHSVRVEHYHADNGRFAETVWLADVAPQQQSITYCGVNAHWQNGVAEKRIRDLVDSARTILLDAKAKWPRAIHRALWPYALRYANHLHMSKPL